MTTNETEDGLGIIQRDSSKNPDYMAVCVFVYLLLESGTTARQLSEALGYGHSMIKDPEATSEKGEVQVTDLTRAKLAQILVKDFLCK